MLRQIRKYDTLGVVSMSDITSYVFPAPMILCKVTSLKHWQRSCYEIVM